MPTSYLTREGFDKLEGELNQLRTLRRQEVAARLREAMADGDAGIDNDAEVDAAKNEQAFVEGRIRELEILLANAMIVDGNGCCDEVEIGAKVTIQEAGSEAEKYMIVGAAEANPREGKISNESPLGKALMGHKVGDTVTVKAPSGAFTVEILKVG